MNKNEKEQIMKIIIPLLIATVAIGLYLFVMQMANKYFNNKVKEIVIEVDNDGNISMPIEGDKEGWMIFWETDGGKLSTKDGSVKEDSSHLIYAGADSSIKWIPEEDDVEFETATIRGTLYQTTDDKDSSYIESGKVQKTLTITLENKDGKISKTEDRMYSNPVKKNSNKEWTEVYIIQNVNNTYTLGFRTGEDIKDGESLSMYWETSDDILSETDLYTGPYPVYQVTNINGNVNKSSLKQVNMVTCTINKDEEVTVSLIKDGNVDDKVYEGTINLKYQEKN